MSTNRRQITIAGFLGVALVIFGAAGVAQDDKQTTEESKKTANDKKDTKKKDYGVMFGTAYGPDDRPMYGVHITIHPVGKKHPNWELSSDRRGEFAQRVPPEPADYLVTGEAQVVAIANGKPQTSKKKHLKGEAKVHMAGAEWHDFSLHLNE